MMDPRTGLLPGQSWNVASGPTWQARIGRDGRAHVIGRELAGHPEYGPRYRDKRRPTPLVPKPGYVTIGLRADLRPRPWHTFERACRAARMHERMVIAAKRREQGGGAMNNSERLALWESEIGATMPPDFKDWHQNSRDEWPIVTRRVIESLREREETAWAVAETLAPQELSSAIAEWHYCYNNEAVDSERFRASRVALSDAIERRVRKG